MNDLEEIPGGVNQSFSRGSSTIIFSQILSQGNPLHINETISSQCIPVWSSRRHVASASLPKGPIIYTPELELISIFYLQTYLLWQILQYSKMLFPGTSNLGHSNGFFNNMFLLAHSTRGMLYSSSLNSKWGPPLPQPSESESWGFTFHPNMFYRYY